MNQYEELVQKQQRQIIDLLQDKTDVQDKLEELQIKF